MADIIQYSGALSASRNPTLERLINRQSEACLASKHKRTFIQEEVLEPTLDALSEKFNGSFENIPIPVGQLIKNAIAAYDPASIPETEPAKAV